MSVKYPRTDLACEANVELAHINGTEYKIEDRDICIVEHLDILSYEASRKLSKNIGSYITVSTPRIQYLDERDAVKISKILGEELRNLILKTVNKSNITRELSVIVVGLGNQSITADAIGPAVVDKICVTRHLLSRDSSLFDILGMCTVSAISPGVLGKTGIESAETVKAAVDSIQPDIILVIDALAARSVERLARTFQISNTGITPGEGIGNSRSELSIRTLGIPVISLGVPTVVHSSTLVFDALTNAGVDDTSETLVEILNSVDSFFVTPKETDSITEKAVSILVNAIKSALVISP